MTHPIRIALLGVQHYHANFWTKAILARKDAAIAGIWDSDPALAGKFANAYALTAFDDRQALLQACDAVAICSTTVEHKELIAAALDVGKPILCEKPLSVNVREGLEICRMLAASPVPFMQGFPKRFDPVSEAVRQIVASGDLGTVTLCRIRHGHSHGLSDDFCKAWFVDPQKSGGGTLLDEGVHAADLLRLLFGEPERAFAALSAHTLGLPVEDTALATFSYRSGLLAEVSTSWCFAAADHSIEIYGTGGTVLVSGVDIASRPTREEAFLQVFRRDGTARGWQVSDIVPHFKTGVFHEHVAWAFIDALAAGTAMPTGARDGLYASAMIEAAYEAARQERMVPIDYPEVGP